MSILDLNNFNTGTINPFAAVHHRDVVNNQTITLLSDTPGSAGVVRYFFLAATNAENNSLLTITTDGNVCYSGPAWRFFAARYVGGNALCYAGALVGMNTNAAGGLNNVSAYSRIPIPFNTSINITYQNLSGQTQELFYWFEEYIGLAANSWPRENHLTVKSFAFPSAAYLSVNTLINDSGLTNGRFLGLAFTADGWPGHANPISAAMEGPIKIYIDGGSIPIITSSGTEDYPGFGFYMQNAGNPGQYTAATDGYSGVTFHAPGAGTYGAYRFHVADPILFSNAVQITWTAGNNILYTGTEDFTGTVYYYTD